MSVPERLYRMLLYIYPASFRRAYGGPMEQAFRDQLRAARAWSGERRLWALTAHDILRSAPAMQVDAARGAATLPVIAACALWSLAALFLGRMELHSDDSGVEVFFVLLLTFLFGLWHPARAWLMALLALAVPAADLVFRRTVPALGHLNGLAALAIFLCLVGCAGSYSGAAVRKLVTRFIR